MRKIYKISALLFIVAVLMGAAFSVSPVAYAADNYYELYEKQGDQNTFYAVCEERIIPYLRYDGEGNFKKYYTDNSINLDIFDTFLDGDLIVAQSSICYEDTRPIDGLNSFKFYLNGHSLSLISWENDVSLYARKSYTLRKAENRSLCKLNYTF